MKNEFILISMRQDFFYNKKELRIAIDTKLIDWVLSLGFKPLLVSDLKTLDFFLKQDKLKIKGILLSGGNEINKNSLRYKIEKRLADVSKRKKIPLLGICHGLQFINFLEGGSLKKISNHVGTYHKIKSNDNYPLRVNSFHENGLKKLGRNFRIIAYSYDNQIEAIKHKKYNWLGWMWHPERDRVFNKSLKKIAKSFFNKK
jgi:putative glutamine amidotransferase|tara:strand:- start:1065 stop:1667 length:603 start_codon:yes stop_codon:yes gene_type:complete